ncbi:MAG: hypothetical protein AB7N76_15995 [Planctomycetota bacterium]
MIRRFAPALLLALALSPLARAQEAKEAGPLAPLVKVGEQLDKGFSAFLAGKEVKEAFAPWKPGKRAVEETRAQLAEAGVKRIVPAGFELELVFLKEGKPLYYLRTFVSTLDGKPAFLAIGGRKLEDGKLYVKAQPLAAFKGAAEPFALAAKALEAALLSGDASKLPVADAEALSKRLALSERDRRGVTKETARARENLGRLPGEVKALGHDELQVRVDDQTSFVYGEGEGEPLGMLRSGFELVEGELVFSPGRFRPAQKPRPEAKTGEAPR